MRLAGIEKMGYYPTPNRVVARLRGMISAGKVHALDPCCGEGKALHGLLKGTNAVLYGIEPDGARCRKAARLFGADNVLNCAYEEADIKGGYVEEASFGLLYLNPPYDSAAGEIDEAGRKASGERKEFIFLRDLDRHLTRGGVLIYIVPLQGLRGEVAAYLAAHYERLEVFRFPAPEFQVYGQGVVLGKKRYGASIPDGTAQAMLERAAREPDLVPELPVKYLERDRYLVPAGMPPGAFQAKPLADEELARIAAGSLIWSRLQGEEARGLEQARPPVPLHTGHIALLLAGGALDGAVGTGDARHLVRGRVIKEQSTETEERGDQTVTIIRDKYRVQVVALPSHGEVVRL